MHSSACFRKLSSDTAYLLETTTLKHCTAPRVLSVAYATEKASSRLLIRALRRRGRRSRYARRAIECGPDVGPREIKPPLFHPRQIRASERWNTGRARKSLSAPEYAVEHYFLFHISTRPCISRRPLSLASRSVANESADVCNSPSLSWISQRWRSTCGLHGIIFKQ
jgi:hypothetical protein